MVLLWTIIAGLARAGGALARLARPLWVNAFFGKAQLASAAYMGLAHGRNDAQKTMGIIALALMGAQGKTLGHKMVRLHPIQGFAAETSSATILTIAAHFGMPVSTTHSISTAIMGVGFAKSSRALRWPVIERIIWAWLLTFPAAGGLAYGLLRLLELAGLA
jgi:inorganic phosphate transporter, PiT family